MKDRFKFRAWDIKDKKYREVIGLGIDRTLLNEIGYVKNETQIFEQCTGLNDKNGKLIYEGDIVECGEFIYRVAYDDIRFASFVLIRTNKLNMFKHYFGEAVESKDVEVIGNIHENPELLEKINEI